MIKVSVMYPNNPGARFDHDYYRDKHMPLVKARLGDVCQYYTIDKGLAGGARGLVASRSGGGVSRHRRLPDLPRPAIAAFDERAALSAP